MFSSKNHRLYSNISSPAANQAQNNGHIQTTKELMRGNAQKSTELVPVWKVYGFLQNDGGITKEMKELHQQTQQKQTFCVHSTQVSPHEWPSSSASSGSSAPSSIQSDKCDNKTKTPTLKQVAWNKRLMHRTRSAIM